MKMSDNEIIKALECCTNNNALDNCDTCPLCDYGNCQDTLIKYCSNTINRQKAEIERLKNHFMYCKVHNHVAIEIGAEHAIIEAIKPQIIKEFAEKLKHKCRDSAELDDYKMTVVTKSDIDDLVKEMTEGQDNG